MTKRELFTKAANGELTEEMMAGFAELVEKMDEANAKRAAKVLEKKRAADDEKAPIRKALLDAMGDEPMTGAQLIEATGLDIKLGSIPSLLKPFVEAGQVEKTDIKVKGKGTQRGYIKAN